jgi:YfiH family protein
VQLSYCDYTDYLVTPTKSSPKIRPAQSRAKTSRPTQSLAKPWSIKKENGLHILQLTPFAKLPWLVHGFSTREGGSSPLDGQSVLNLSFTDWDTRENMEKNRAAFQNAVGAKSLRMAPLKQVHSDVIEIFHAAPDSAGIGDASATAHPGLLLAIQTADCVPILLVDPRKRAIAAIHAGWRGTLARITQKAVGVMQREFSSRPSNLLAAIGPSIGPCCYEVGAELVTQFTSQFADASDYFDEPRTGDEPNPLQWLNMHPPGHQPPPKAVHLDLRKANRSQLLAAGLRKQNIFTSELCTACRRDLFFSYRKEGPRSGRLLSVIGLRPQKSG